MNRAHLTHVPPHRFEPADPEPVAHQPTPHPELPLPGSTVEAHAVTTDAPHLAVEAQDQGLTNACGTTSLAEVLSYWGQPTTHEQIDSSIRHFNLFTAPDAIVAYARAHGMRSELKDGASLEDVARMVDQGAPPIVIIDPTGPEDAGLHYVTVIGYQRDAQGKVSSLTYADSSDQSVQSMPADKFSEEWGNLRLGGVGTGLTNVMISMVPNDDRAVTGLDGQTRRACDVSLPTSDVGHTLESAFARGVASVVSGVTTAADTLWHGLQSAWHAIFG